MTEICRPLIDLFKKDMPFVWGPQQQAAFDAIRSALVNVATLSHYQPCGSLHLTTDASNGALGAVLEQLQSSKWTLLKFWLRKLQGAELNYAYFNPPGRLLCG